MGSYCCNDSQTDNMDEIFSEVNGYQTEITVLKIYINNKYFDDFHVSLTENLDFLRKIIKQKTDQYIIFLQENNPNLCLEPKDEQDIKIEDILEDGNNCIFITTNQNKQENLVYAQKNSFPNITTSQMNNSTEFFLRVKRKVRSNDDIPRPPKGEVGGIFTKKKPITNSIFLNEIKGLKIYQYPRIKFDSMQEAACQTFLFLGETGSGKSSLINSFINYIMNIEINDPFRYKLVVESDSFPTQAHSQTSEVKIYSVAAHNNFPPIRIIDTPGFGDTQGLEKDQEITFLIHSHFKNQLKSISSICVVARSTDARLNIKQRYVFNKILELFGNDVSNNIAFLLTFCDSSDPPVKSALKEHFSKVINKLSNPWCFKFNNSSLFSSNKEKFSDIFWKLGKDSFEVLMDKINVSRDQSLNLSNEVLNLRKAINDKVCLLLILLDEFLTLEDQIAKLDKIIENNKSLSNDSADFFEIETFEFQKTPLYNNKNSIICSVCNLSCVEEWIGEDFTIKNCIIFSNSPDGKCKICPKNCHFSLHMTLPYLVTRKVTKKNIQKPKNLNNFPEEFDLLQQNRAILNKLSHEKVLDGNVIVQEIQEILEILKGNAINSDFIEVNSEYINMLIEDKNIENRESLVKIQKREEILNKILKFKPIFVSH